ATAPRARPAPRGGRRSRAVRRRRTVRAASAGTSRAGRSGAAPSPRAAGGPAGAPAPGPRPGGRAGARWPPPGGWARAGRRGGGVGGDGLLQPAVAALPLDELLAELADGQAVLGPAALQRLLLLPQPVDFHLHLLADGLDVVLALASEGVEFRQVAADLLAGL